MARSLIDRIPTDDLEAGEHWLAAQAMTVRGPKTMLAWAAEHDLDDLLADRKRVHPGATGTATIPEAMPRSFVAAVTERRLALFETKFGGRPGDLLFSWPLESTSLDIVDEGDRVRSRLFLFGVADGALVAGAAGVNGKALAAADAFVEAFRSGAARMAG
ncbi:MAG: hypothetical protein ACE367_04100 [Acidimicrobiales bacterium]